MATTKSGMPTIDEVLAAQTPEQKLATAFGLRNTAWQLTAAGVRLREPELDEAAVEERVRSIFSRVASS
jgi:hypothetical protein